MTASASGTRLRGDGRERLLLFAQAALAENRRVGLHRRRRRNFPRQLPRGFGERLVAGFERRGDERPELRRIHRRERIERGGADGTRGIRVRREHGDRFRRRGELVRARRIQRGDADGVAVLAEQRDGERCERRCGIRGIPLAVASDDDAEHAVASEFHRPLRERVERIEPHGFRNRAVRRDGCEALRGIGGAEAVVGIDHTARERVSIIARRDEMASCVSRVARASRLPVEASPASTFGCPRGVL